MRTAPPDPNQQWKFSTGQIVGIACVAIATVYFGSSFMLNGGTIPPSLPPPPPPSATPAPTPSVAPFLMVSVDTAGNGYRIVGLTNLPDGTTVLLSQNDAQRRGAIFDEVKVEGGRFIGPTYTVAGKFKATASVPGRQVPCTPQPFSFRGGKLVVK